jgi:hypothetical protein
MNKKERRRERDAPKPDDKNLSYLDEEFILSNGFTYGLFDSDTLWKKGSDGNDWWCKISLWQRLVTWHYVTEINGLPRTVEYGYLSFKEFNKLFR